MRAKVQTTIIFSVLFLLSSCGDGGPKVGEGAAFSTLDPVPTGEELYTSFQTGLFSSAGVFLSKLATSSKDTTRSQSFSETEVDDCGGFGTVRKTVTASGTQQNATFEISAQYEDCALTMSLNSQTFEETANGSIKLRGRSLGSTISGSYDFEFTVSGDLGFSVDCNAQGTGSDLTSGECVFKDSEDTEIIMEFEG